MFTAYDIEQRLRAIDEIYAFLDSMLAISGNGELLRQSIQDKIQTKVAASELDKHADKAEAAVEKYRAIVHKYEYFADIFSVAQIDTGSVPIFETIAASRNLRAEIQELEQRGQLEKAPEYLRNNIRLAEWRAAVDKLWPWINGKKNDLISKRREYEAAEVYPK
jgi:hypothetical protein